MKMIFKTLPLALIVMSIYSCTSDDETVQDAKDNSSVVTTFTCTQENDGTTTKAALDSDSKTNSKTILWKTGDAISIFDVNKTNNKYSLNSESDGNSTGTFSGTGAVTGSYVALYPYTAGAILNNDGTVSNIVLPDEQEAVAGGFDPNAALMIAKSTTTSLQFKNAVGFIKVQLADGFDCKKIILRAADKTTPLAGKGTLKFDAYDNPSIDFDGSSELSYSITLSGEITGGKAYYIAVPAGEYSANWTLTFVTENKNYMRQVAQPITFVRSVALKLGTFATDGDYWVKGSRGIVSAGQEVDLGLTIEKDGKQYNVIFAKSNLTATGLAAKESDFGDYFAWGATEPWLTSYIYDGSSFSEQTWKTGYTGGYLKANAPFYNGSSYTEYTTQNDVLNAADDAANVILGGDWRLPTTEIWDALYKANTKTVNWGNNGDMKFIGTEKGMRITKKDASSISPISLFLPAAAYGYGTSFDYDVGTLGSVGYYWSGTAYSGTKAYHLYFRSSTVIAQRDYTRHIGFSVRPVRLVEVSQSLQ